MVCVFMGTRCVFGVCPLWESVRRDGSEGERIEETDQKKRRGKGMSCIIEGEIVRD